MSILTLDIKLKPINIFLILGRKDLVFHKRIGLISGWTFKSRPSRMHGKTNNAILLDPKKRALRRKAVSITSVEGLHL